MESEITIRFAMTKGEGQFPTVADFSEKERADFRKAMTLSLCWESEIVGVEDVQIEKVEILYDGITHFGEESYGYWFEDASEFLEGYPAPIVRFTLNKAVDPEEFCRAIHTSSYYIQTDSMDEGFIAEDWNGYSSVVDDVEDVADFLEDEEVYCGKTFTFAEGMPEYGHPLPAVDFALVPQAA